MVLGGSIGADVALRGICVVLERKYDIQKYGILAWSVVVDSCCLYFHFSLTIGQFYYVQITVVTCDRIVQSSISEMMLVAILNMLKRYSSQIPVIYSQNCLLGYYSRQAGDGGIDSVGSIWFFGETDSMDYYLYNLLLVTSILSLVCSFTL